MLIVIKSAQPGDVPPARINFTEDRRVKQCRYVLVDVKYTHPLHCQYNTETYNSIAEFLSTEDSFKYFRNTLKLWLLVWKWIRK